MVDFEHLQRYQNYSTTANGDCCTSVSVGCHRTAGTSWEDQVWKITTAHAQQVFATLELSMNNERLGTTVVKEPVQLSRIRDGGLMQPGCQEQHLAAAVGLGVGCSTTT